MNGEYLNYLVFSDNIFKVKLSKGSGGVGLCISCVEDNHPNDPFQGIVWVKQVSPFGPAAASQKFQQGDIILEVNSQQLKGMMKSVSSTCNAIGFEILSKLIGLFQYIRFDYKSS